mmetsp:Transcript_99982/g.182384  ORF Transcript_99982/g.182384 Transcript_99982/m.182384 type:complete len:452 (-) Transcript_99982:52-1407(-)
MADASFTNEARTGTPKADGGPATATATGDAFGEVGNIPETLHMAAKSGNVDSVRFLLRQKADPSALDKSGLTALQIAEMAGKKDVVEILKKETKPPAALNATGEFEDDFEDTSAASPTSPASPKAAETTLNVAAEPAADREAGIVEDEPLDFGNEDFNDDFGQSPKNGSPKSPGNSKVGDYKDLKSRTAFAASTVDGVLKRTTFMNSMSGYRTSPQWKFGERGNSMFIRSSSTPAPGSYNMPPEDKSKFKATPQFSFGGSSRFGLGMSPTKLQPGPGQYNPKDPSLNVDTKVGFGTSIRGKTNPAAQANPGPGAYESKSTMGSGLMFTARGRHPTSYMRSRSMPGPGAYTPSVTGVYQSSPKCGFGTSTRGEMGKSRMAGQPGPGAYELQNFKCMGKDSIKYSATSRRRMHDLNSYVTPGPGTYNAHVTSFGFPGAPSLKHTDMQAAGNSR